MLRPKLNRIWTSSNPTLRRDPGDAKYIQGWISEIPTFQVLNYLQYKVDTTLLALAERGIAEWGPDVQYGLNSLSWDETNKVIYISTVGSPDRTKAPSTNPTQWVASSIQVSRAEYDSVVAAINAHIADVTGNPHKLTAGRLNAYNKTEIDNIVSQYRTLVANHANDKNNPHQLTATIIGAVPATGGTYTGDVTFNSNVYFDVNKVNTIRKTGGMFLQNGTGIIGITDAGVGVVGTTTSTTPIVTESTYPAIKAAQEPNYAVPPPIVSIPFIRSLHMPNGNGILNSNFASDVTYDRAGRYLINNTYGENGSLILTPNPLEGVVDSVVAMDIMINSTSANSVAEPYSIGFGQVGRIYIRASGIVIGRSAAVLGNTNIADGKLHRVVQRVTANSATLFIDGVQVAQDTTTAQGTIEGSVATILGKSSTLPALALISVSICNLRGWNTALTNKQISTL